MRETTPAAMPTCFDRWCKKFDDLLRTKAQKSLPLDIELYQHGNSLPEGKKDPEFKKKPTLALELIDQSLSRGYRAGIVLIDSAYGNNTSFLLELETRKLKYIGGIAKNRNILVKTRSKNLEEIKLDEYAKWISRLGI